MSSAGLEKIIDIGNRMTAARYYPIATTTILFYDFFLTLADEIEYAWHGRKTWIFAIFLVNRYFPVAYQIWWLYIQRVIIQHFTNGCNRTAFFEVLATVIPTLIAQVVITLRIYAVTRKNRIIVSCLCVIMISQFSLGLQATVYAVKGGSLPILPIPLPVYMMCTFVGQLSVGIAFTTISLTYDALAFSVIVFLVVRSNITKVPLPSIFRIIARDATSYFLIIFTSHLVIVMFYWLASGGTKLLPSSGNTVYLPVMITRLLLSLRKANASQEPGWSFGEPTTHTALRFAERRGSAAIIHLDTFASTHEGTRGQE